MQVKERGYSLTGSWLTVIDIDECMNSKKYGDEPLFFDVILMEGAIASCRGSSRNAQARQ
jgi:hypothetical protein